MDAFPSDNLITSKVMMIVEQWSWTEVFYGACLSHSVLSLSLVPRPAFRHA